MTLGKDVKVTPPKEAQAVAAILKEMNITDYEPGVTTQILEFVYRYVTGILDDARSLASYAKKTKSVEMDDVKLAIQMHVEKSFTTPPPRELLLDIARQRNAVPLPSIKAQCGLRLPPDRYCISGTNYRLKKTARSVRTGSRIVQGGAKPLVTMVTKPPNPSPSLSLVSKPIAPQQKTVTISKPIIKVTGAPAPSLPKFQVTPGNVKMEDLPGKRKRDEDM